MPYCKNCGEEITDHQFSNYNMMCPQCIRLIDSVKKSEKAIDKFKAKQDAGLNFGCAFFFTIVCIVGAIFVATLGDPAVFMVLIIPGLIALLNWYFYFVNKKKAQS